MNADEWATMLILHATMQRGGLVQPAGAYSLPQRDYSCSDSRSADVDLT